MYVCVHLALLCFVPTVDPAPSLVRHATVRVAPRNRLPQCLLGQRVRDEMVEIKEEIDMERAAALVELPVMFISKQELQLDELGLLEKGERPSTFDFERWTQHRSSSRYYRLLLGVLFGVTTRRVLPVLLANVIFSSLVCIYAQLCLTNPDLVTLQLPIQPFELTAPALGLLLVFRSDNAYARFKEGSELSWEMSTSIRSVRAHRTRAPVFATVSLIVRPSACLMSTGHAEAAGMDLRATCDAERARGRGGARHRLQPAPRLDHERASPLRRRCMPNTLGSRRPPRRRPRRECLQWHPRPKLADAIPRARSPLRGGVSTAAFAHRPGAHCIRRELGGRNERAGQVRVLPTNSQCVSRPTPPPTPTLDPNPNPNPNPNP